jgi:TniQ protein
VWAETGTIYPFWDLARPGIPARSRLYPLEPIGVGTGEVESLSSYVLRLADAHCLPLTALLDGVVTPLIRETRLRSTTASPESVLVEARRPINGMGVTAAICVQALESLTSRTDLHWLTTMTWQGVFSTQHWLRPMRAWCPACFESQRREERVIFEPLLWTLRVVTLCPIHRRALVTICPHCRGESLPMNRHSRPGRCPRCMRWLGSMDTAEPPPDESMADDQGWPLWVAKTAGSLLAAPPVMTARPERATLIETIARCVDHFAEGRIHAFAFHFGISKNVMRRSLKQNGTPGLEMALKISYLAGVSPLDLINGTAVFPDPASRQELFVYPPSQHHRNKYRHYGQERLILQQALNETPPPSPAEVAARLQYFQTLMLCRAHPELYRQIAARYIAFRQEQRRLQVGEEVEGDQLAERIISAALQEHPPPSACEVARRLGYPRRRQLERAFPEFYRRLVDRRDKYKKQIDEAVRNCFQSAMSEEPPPEVSELERRLGFISAQDLRRNCHDLCDALRSRRSEYRQRRVERIEAILKQASQERPAPSLIKVAERCGYKTSDVMKTLFPDLSRQIMERYAAGRKEWAVQVKAQLLAALDDAIPPSVTELSRRLKFDKGTLYEYFPELCAEISARRARHRKEEMVKRKQQRREEIRRIVIELHNQGIYPSRSKVEERFSRAFGMSTVFDGKVIREVKSELGIHMPST